MKRYSFAWPFRVIGAVGLPFLVLGLIRPDSEFDKPNGKLVFILVGALFSLLLLVVNEITVADGRYQVRKGFVFWNWGPSGEASRLAFQIVSSDDGLLLYLADGGKHVIQLSSGSRSHLQRKQNAIAKELGAARFKFLTIFDRGGWKPSKYTKGPQLGAVSSKRYNSEDRLLAFEK